MCASRLSLAFCLLWLVAEINSQSLWSRNHPNRYPNNYNESWVIRETAPNRGITLQFAAFRTESCCDRLIITEGANPGGRELSRYAGVTSPFEARFNVPAITLQFTADSSVTDSGFLIYYGNALGSSNRPQSGSPTPGFNNGNNPSTPDNNNNPPTTLQPPVLNVMGTVRSRNYPNNYPDNYYYSWTLPANKNNRQSVSFRFLDFQTEQCCDFVVFYDSEYRQLARYSGALNAFNVSFNLPSVQMVFSSDGSVVQRGFITDYAERDSVPGQGSPPPNIEPTTTGAGCQNGAAPLGTCINGLCPVGTECAFGGVCCPVSSFESSTWDFRRCPDGVYYGDCFNGQCASGMSCMNGLCCPGQGFEQTTVDFNQRCPDGTYYGNCLQWTCASGMSCVNGLCCPGQGFEPTTADYRPCPDGGGNYGFCTNGMCGAGTSCINGVCCPGQGFEQTTADFRQRCPDGMYYGDCFNGQCAAGMSCMNGLCCPGQGFEPTTTDNYYRPCPNGGGIFGTCVNGLCGAGMSCMNGLCCPGCPDGVYYGDCFNGQCASGMSCMNGLCCPGQGFEPSTPDFRPRCLDGVYYGDCFNGQCASGMSCMNGLCCPGCLDGVYYGDCFNGQCASGMSCMNGLCCPGCPDGTYYGDCSNGQCASGMSCANGVCCPACSNGVYYGDCFNGQCSSGMSCANGICCPATWSETPPSPTMNPPVLNVHGTIRSPNYPSSYRDNEVSEWHLRSSTPGGGVSVQFLDFNTETCCDYVTFYSAQGGQQLARYSGHIQTPFTATFPTQSAVLMRFQSDYSVADRGFVTDFADTTSRSAPPATPPRSTGQPFTNAPQTMQPPVLTVSGTIKSRSYPNPYPNNENVKWVLRPAAGSSNVAVQFFDFQTEQGFDFVTFFAGETTSSQQIGRYSGHLGRFNVTFPQSVVLMTFTSDNSVSDRGFITNIPGAALPDMATPPPKGSPPPPPPGTPAKGSPPPPPPGTPAKGSPPPPPPGTPAKGSSPPPPPGTPAKGSPSPPPGTPAKGSPPPPPPGTPAKGSPSPPPGTPAKGSPSPPPGTPAKGSPPPPSGTPAKGSSPPPPPGTPAKGSSPPPPPGTPAKGSSPPPPPPPPRTTQRV